jgi:sigma-B regulation protein RsbU (phosphoserine phosphatase)
VIYDELSVQLEPGDSLLFCTDGVTEARNADDEEFGTDRLQELCRTCSANTPLVLLEHLFASLEEFTGVCRQWDDMTATVFHYAAP